jgi:hypothetical protein
MANAQYGKLTVSLIVAWFMFCLLASGMKIFSLNPSRPPILLGLAALTPIIVFAVWSAASERFRQFTQSLNPRLLTMVQSWRIAGYVFLVLYQYRILPGAFALPAGWGDVAIGLTAPLVAMTLAKPEHNKSFILWQVLGISDLVIAVAMGTTSRLISPHGIATSAMTALPLSLIPTFAVPLFMILHFICIAQARQWTVRAHSHFAEPLPSSAL